MASGRPPPRFTHSGRPQSSRRFRLRLAARASRYQCPTCPSDPPPDRREPDATPYRPHSRNTSTASAPPITVSNTTAHPLGLVSRTRAPHSVHCREARGVACRAPHRASAPDGCCACDGAACEGPLRQAANTDAGMSSASLRVFIPRLLTLIILIRDRVLECTRRSG